MLRGDEDHLAADLVSVAGADGNLSRSPRSQAVGTSSAPAKAFPLRLDSVGPGSERVKGC